MDIVFEPFSHISQCTSLVVHTSEYMTLNGVNNIEYLISFVVPYSSLPPASIPLPHTCYICCVWLSLSMLVSVWVVSCCTNSSVNVFLLFVLLFQTSPKRISLQKPLISFVSCGRSYLFCVVIRTVRSIIEIDLTAVRCNIKLFFLCVLKIAFSFFSKRREVKIYIKIHCEPLDNGKNCIFVQTEPIAFGSSI